MLEKRSFQPELIDLGPAYYTESEYDDCLLQLDRIGRFLGGDEATYKAFKGLNFSPNSILDVGCGGGLFTGRLAKRYPQAKVIGLDISKEAIDFANRQIKPSNLEFRLGLRPELDYPAGSFDVVTSTLVCHHLNDQELIDFLKQATQVAKKAVIINDLHRHPLALAGIRVLTPFLFPNRLVSHDGPLSVKRAFKKQDWIELLQRTGISPARCSITWNWAFRWIVRIDQ